MNRRTRIEGKVWRFGDHVNTDVIIPARHCVTLDADELGRHAMEGAAPGFSSSISPGDLVVAGANFGCGSSRETAPLALLHAGVGAVVAASFARIFFRNSLNVGLPIFESPEAADACRQGDRLVIEPSAGRIENARTGEIFTFAAYPDDLMAIVDAGGLVPYVRRRLLGET